MYIAKFTKIGLFVLVLFGVASSYAVTSDVIGDNPTCDIDTFGNAGSVDLEAKFEPNEITVNFYDDGEDTNPEIRTCMYDGILNLPPKPIRDGYVFLGWKLRGSVIETVKKIYETTMINACYKSVNGRGEGSVSSGCSKEDIVRGEWKKTFADGVVYGEASCNNESGAWTDNGVFVEDDRNIKYDGISVGGNGEYCWCRITGFTPTSDQKVSFTNSGWVLVRQSTQCGFDCSRFCIDSAFQPSWFEKVLYNQVKK